MTDGPNQSLAREGLQFFGAMGAGLSHELSNVFNIINELSGLQQDIIAANADGGAAGLARVADLAARVKSQVVRGEEINRSLHRLSHSVDCSNLVFDLGESLTLFAALAARAARLAEVALEVRQPDASMAHRGDPFALLVILHAAFRAALAAAASERRVGIWAEAGVDGTRIIVKSADPVQNLTSGALTDEILSFGYEGLAAVHLEDSPEGGHNIVLELDDVTTTATAQAGDPELEA